MFPAPNEGILEWTIWVTAPLIFVMLHFITSVTAWIFVGTPGGGGSGGGSSAGGSSAGGSSFSGAGAGSDAGGGLDWGDD